MKSAIDHGPRFSAAEVIREAREIIGDLPKCPDCGRNIRKEFHKKRCEVQRWQGRANTWENLMVTPKEAP